MTNRTGHTVRAARHTHGARGMSPRVVVGVAVPGGPGLAEMFHDRGWDVLPAVSGADARQLARRGRAAVVVLSVDGHDESGVLTCAKLTRCLPRLRVVLVGPANDAAERFAKFAGAAAYVAEGSGPEAILAAVRTV